MTAQTALLPDHNFILQAQAVNSVTATPSPRVEDNGKDNRVEVLEPQVIRNQFYLNLVKFHCIVYRTSFGH